jgi:hypothetical protein
MIIRIDRSFHHSKEEEKVSGLHIDKSGVKRSLCQCVDATPYFPPERQIAERVAALSEQIAQLQA